MNMQQLTLDHDGISLSAELYGDDKAALVILVHGFPDTPHSWQQVVPRLVDAGYRVLTPWLRGYTLGSATAEARYDLLSVAADIDAWRRHLNADQAHLVGHDWGAAVANVLAGQQQDQDQHHKQPWTTVSLLAVPPMPVKAQWRKLLPQLPRQLAYSSYMPVMQLSASHRLLTRNNAAYVRRLWQKWSPSWEFSTAQFEPTKTVFSNPQLAWASTRYYRNLFRWHDPRVRQAISLMQQPFVTPTLALAGLDDGCMHASTHQQIAATASLRGQLTVKQLPGCGHFLQAEQPEIVADILLEHFRQAA
jgi:pimeloyl-ACP methyl ester carboxylesterase